ncbi:MAG: right-handed parallel beta-helix repeat-containing protein, partial [Kiritimatiellae bacterium]|nr:right-handed parallel beta-helix repeat-containing protein [Kiritimatiellia bacterium]
MRAWEGDAAMSGAKTLGRLLAIWIVLGAAAAHGRTWTVEQDFSGDFWNIQNAVDIAEDGDVIEIGPGRYQEYSTVYNSNGWPILHVYANIGEKSLTLIGSGTGVTIIGPEDPNFHPWPGVDVAIVNAYESRGLTMSGITFDHSPFLLVHIDRATSLHASDCEFRDARYGVVGSYTAGGSIVQCRFENLSQTGVSVFNPTTNFRVEDCTFTNVYGPVALNWSPAYCDVINCVMIGGRIGVSFSGGSSGRIIGCVIGNFVNYGVSLLDSGDVEIHDTVIEQSTGWGMSLGGATTALIHDNVISTQSGGCVYLPDPCDGMRFTNNSLIRGGGYLAKTNDYFPFTPAVYFHLENNYWGTTDADEIATYIIDGH